VTEVVFFCLVKTKCRHPKLNTPEILISPDCQKVDFSEKCSRFVAQWGNILKCYSGLNLFIGDRRLDYNKFKRIARYATYYLQSLLRQTAKGLIRLKFLS
jgi:hypothetical protein